MIRPVRIARVCNPQTGILHDRAPTHASKEVVIAVRADEAGHRDVNHGFADELAWG
jgi:ubiquinol oxidase